MAQGAAPVRFRVADWKAWRTTARAALNEGMPPCDVAWEDALHEQGSLFGEAAPPTAAPAATIRVPRSFMKLGPRVACHRDPVRWSLLYAALWRVTHGEPRLLALATDPLTSRLARLAKSVDRDVHKMHAFVRFRRVEDDEGECWIAWYEPDHHIVERVARFFVDRFTSMRFSIFTPRRSLHWDRETCWFDEGRARDEVAGRDALADMWRVYYASTYNPARTRWKAMVREMPVRFWKNLPEATVIDAVTRGAADRVARMIEASPSPPEEEFRARKRRSIRPAR